MAKNKCKLLVTDGGNGIQIAVDQNNTVFIRTYGTGYHGDCWGTWHTFDLNPKAWRKSDQSRVIPPRSIKAWPIKQETLDTISTLLDITK